MSSSVADERADAAGDRSHRPDTAFIMMLISNERPEPGDACNKIKECNRRFGISAIRAHDIKLKDVITRRIDDKVKTAGIVAALKGPSRPVASLPAQRPMAAKRCADRGAVGPASPLGHYVRLLRLPCPLLHASRIPEIPPEAALC